MAGHSDVRVGMSADTEEAPVLREPTSREPHSSTCLAEASTIDFGHNSAVRDNRGFFEALIGDGRPLIVLTALCLIGSGGFALFLSASGQFLPHDIQFLGMSAEELCALFECRIVHFMFHDRVSFGGVLIAIGALYLWLTEFPLKERSAWAWWALFLSAVVGFLSFLTYIGYGYLDSWHGTATLFLLPCFISGMILTRRSLEGDRSVRSILKRGEPVEWRTPFGIGILLLLLTGMGMMGAGFTIMTVGMTSVFVPQDLEYMATTAEALRALNSRLIPLIAHDRAGFGGGLFSTGVAWFLCVWCSSFRRSLWQVLALAGAVGFATAIGIHPLVGYLSVPHLAPAILGALMFLVGIVLTFRAWKRES